MALVLTKFVADGVEVEECLNKRYRQRLLLVGTGSTADVTYDVGALAGTFWTAVGASAVGLRAIKALADINTRSLCLATVESRELILTRVKIATVTGAGQYKIVDDVSGPTITVNAADGPTAFHIEIYWTLKDAQEPVQDSLSA